MCETLTTFDGAEISTLADAAAYGLDVADTIAHWGPGNCLCRAGDLAVLLAGDRSAWRMGGFGFDEVGPDGRTWWDGFDIQVPVTRRVFRSDRSDGRHPVTLDAAVARRTAARSK